MRFCMKFKSDITHGTGGNQFWSLELKVYLIQGRNMNLGRTQILQLGFYLEYVTKLGDN